MSTESESRGARGELIQTARDILRCLRNEWNLLEFGWTKAALEEERKNSPSVFQEYQPVVINGFPIILCWDFSESTCRKTFILKGPGINLIREAGQEDDDKEVVKVVEEYLQNSGQNLLIEDAKVYELFRDGRYSGGDCVQIVLVKPVSS